MDAVSGTSPNVALDVNAQSVGNCLGNLCKN